MPSPRISIVTVCFNAADTIDKTMRSVAAQSYSNLEHIVIDGASTDNTLAIVDSYPERVAQVISEKDEGIFDAMNKGIGRASGDVVYFLNADDSFVDEGVLQDVAKVFEEDESRMLVYGNVVLSGGPSGIRNFPASAFRKRSISEFLHNSFCHQAVFVRRSLFARLGLFDQRYKYSADYEWIIRAFKANSGTDFFFLNRDIAYYFCQGRSQQHVATTRKEVDRMQWRHFFSLEYAWYYLRYVFLRRLKKRLFDEAY